MIYYTAQPILSELRRDGIRSKLTVASLSSLLAPLQETRCVSGMWQAEWGGTLVLRTTYSVVSYRDRYRYPCSMKSSAGRLPVAASLRNHHDTLNLKSFMLCTHTHCYLFHVSILHLRTLFSHSSPHLATAPSIICSLCPAPLLPQFPRTAFAVGPMAPSPMFQ